MALSPATHLNPRDAHYALAKHMPPTFEEMEAATKRLPMPPPSSPDDSDNLEGLTKAEIEHLANSFDVTDLAPKTS